MRHFEGNIANVGKCVKTYLYTNGEQRKWCQVMFPKNMGTKRRPWYNSIEMLSLGLYLRFKSNHNEKSVEL